MVMGAGIEVKEVASKDYIPSGREGTREHGNTGLLGAGASLGASFTVWGMNAREADMRYPMNRPYWT
ncbi:MAG: hypothetical protein IPI39_04090 [Candidatus Obscuribacter sp.]|nr:hypothetical protein [Candidatus Obscuribacter sp.]MBK9619575.1 hypothetical protein [Candidatus Obscuribacter sp.]